MHVRIIILARLFELKSWIKSWKKVLEESPGEESPVESPGQKVLEKVLEESPGHPDSYLGLLISMPWRKSGCPALYGLANIWVSCSFYEGHAARTGKAKSEA